MKKLKFDAHERLKSVVKDEKITGGRLGTYTVFEPKVTQYWSCPANSDSGFHGAPAVAR
jgi:hypothetical protein